MMFMKVPYNILLLVSVTALLMLLSMDVACARKCKNGCKLNHKNKYVCIANGGQVIQCYKIGFATADAFTPDAAPGPIPDLGEEYDPYVIDYRRPLGYVYDYEDRRYEYEDGTAVPGFETFNSIVPTVPTGHPSRPPKARRCRRLDPPCSDGCKRGRCCLDGQRAVCVEVPPSEDES
jgi:hypothetical protein